MPRRKSKEEIVSEFKGIHGDYYDYSKVNYINTATKIEVICPKHGSFWITPNHHKKGVGCSKCYFDSQRITKNEFVIKAEKIFGKRYDYSLFNEFPDVGTKIKIFCNEHQVIFRQEPRNHLRGHTGCKYCRSQILTGQKDSIGKFKTQKQLNEDFIRKANEIHDYQYDYSVFVYLGVDKKGQIICKDHGVFWQTPSNHLKGTKCPRCSLKNKFVDSFKEKCRIENVDYHRALKRRQAGLSDEKIFTEGYVRNLRETNKIIINGRIFPNLEEAIRNLNPRASSKTISRWLKQGLAPEEAFSKIPNPGYANGIIYLITNKITQKKYVGLTIQTINKRWKYHLEQAYAGHIKDYKSLHASIREYGPIAFEIEKIDSGKTKIELEKKERYWIKKLKTLVPYGYNISTGGVSGGSNKRPTEIDNIKFPGVREAAEYLSATRNISIYAAKRRILKKRIDVKKRASVGKSFVKTKPYKTWSRIVHCVNNPNSKSYSPDIKVKERWKDFENFFEDVGFPPSENMAFIRLDKSKGFYPENCKWVSKSEASKINAKSMKENGTLSTYFRKRYHSK